MVGSRLATIIHRFHCIAAMQLVGSRGVTILHGSHYTQIAASWLGPEGHARTTSLPCLGRVTYNYFILFRTCRGPIFHLFSERLPHSTPPRSSPTGALVITPSATPTTWAGGVHTTPLANPPHPSPRPYSRPQWSGAVVARRQAERGQLGHSRIRHRALSQSHLFRTFLLAIVCIHYIHDYMCVRCVTVCVW